ncbi:hypothetical protein GCM10027590_14540 [Nocardiopsis nanhaiensis]
MPVELLFASAVLPLPLSPIAPGSVGASPDRPVPPVSPWPLGYSPAGHLKGWPLLRDSYIQ